MDNAEFSQEKARDLRDLAGEASLAGFFAAGELTRTDFDFLHDGLAFSGVARVRLLLIIGVTFVSRQCLEVACGLFTYVCCYRK